jgi:hypothetical protein
MNEEAIQDSYNVFVSQGYTKSIDEFKKLINTNPEALNDSYKAFSNQGYSKSIDDYKSLMGIGAQPQVKKKGSSVSNIPQQQKIGTTELPVADGSLATPAPTKETEEEDYFTGSFGNVLRGFDSVVPLGIGDFVDDMARSVASGYRQGNVAETADKLLLKGHKATPEQIQKFIEANKNAQQMKPSAEMQDYTKIYEGEGKGFWGVIKGLANNPSIIPEVLASSLTSMATNTDALKAAGSAIGAGATYGAITGAAVTPEFLGAGAIPGAISGAASAVPYAFGLASTVVEAGSTFGELLTDELKGKELTKENVKAILEDPEKLQSIRNKAIARGVIIGTVDALTGKLASGVGAKILSKSAAKSAVGAATKQAVIKSTAAGSAIEALGGSAGEATARAATGQDMDVSEIALEGLAELPGGVRSTIQARFAKPSYKVNGEKVTASDIDNLIETMTPEELHATDIVINNDYEGRMFKIQDKVVTNTIKQEVKKANPDLNEPSLNAITELEKELQNLEGNKTQTGKDKASLLRNQIKDIQENQLQDEAVIETVVAETPTIQEDEVDSEISRLDDYNKKILENEKSYSWEKESANEYFADKRKYIEKTLEIAKKDLKENPESEFDKRLVERTEKALKELETIKTEQDAVQKPTTDESVLRTEQPEMGLQGVGEGNAKPEGTTTEKEIADAKQKFIETSTERKGSELSKDELDDIDSIFNEKLKALEKPEETITTEKPKEIKEPSVEQQFKDINEGNVVTFEYKNENEVPEIFKDKISSKGENNGEPFVKVTMAKSLADFHLQEKPTQETTPEVQPTVTEKPTEVTPTEKPEEVVAEAKPVKEQWEIDYERRKAKVDEFNAENRPSALENEQPRKRKNSDERSKLEDDAYESKKNISRAEDTDLAIEEYNKKKKELEDFDNKTQDIENNQRVNDLIYDEIEQKEKDKDNYEYSEEFNKDPREAALKSQKDLVDFLEERGAENDLESIDRYKNDINLLEKDIKDNPLKENTFLREEAKPTEVAPTEKSIEVTPAQKVTFTESKPTEVAPAEKPAQTIDAAIKTLEKSKEYIEADDIQKEALVRATRKEFGLKEKSAPSVNRLFGKLKDIAKITMTEKAALVKQIKDTAKGARESVKAFKLASQQLTKDIKELKESGKITSTQLTNILVKFSKVNVLNDASVSSFVDYMTKVFADADYVNKIDIAKGRLKTAKKNIVTKLGIADGLVGPLQRLFSINPTLIPDAYLGKYLDLVNMFGKRESVLTLEEKSKTIKDVQAILDEINNEQSLSDELADRFNNSENKVFKDGKLDYSASIKEMLKQGEIDSDELELMTKYKSNIAPQVEKTKLTEEEVQVEKEILIKEVKKSTVNFSELDTRDEREKAKELNALVKGDAINELTNVEIKNLLKVIDNINNGYLPHYTQLVVEKINAINNSKVLESAVDKSKPLPISKLYAKAKSLLTKKDAILEMIRRNPLFNIDQVLGDFKTKDIFNSILEKAAEAESKFTSQLKNVRGILEKAEERVAKSHGLNPDATLMSKFKMMTYMVQLEYDSNTDNKQVNPAAAYLKATIKHIEAGKSKFGERDAEKLQKIYDDYTNSDGNIDNEKLYNSFNSAEKNALEVIRNTNESLKDKAEYTAAIIRGQKINPLNNYVHLNVLHEYKPTDMASGQSFADQYNNSLKPSTKAKSLIERTGKVSPLNFDVFASAQRGAKFVLMDYHLTEPIRTARKTINRTISNLESKGKLPKEKRQIVNAINNAFEESVSNLITNSYMETSIGDDVVDYISKQGYRAVLAGTGRFASELLSNVGFVLISDPSSFTEGTKYNDVTMSDDAPAIMNNVNSKETNRIFPTDTLSGRMIDTNILSQASGIKGGKSKNPIVNKIEQIWNRTGKKYVNAVELTADVLISTPDKVIMRPIWFGSFAFNFKKITGNEIDFKKIAANDEAYMNENKKAIEEAKNIADERSVITGASNNAFTGILKGTSKPDQSITIKAFNNFNNFMTRFMVYEYVTARTGIYAAMGNGSLTRRQGVALLGAVATRMTVYSLLIKVLGGGIIGLIFDDEEEEDEKSAAQSVGQALASTFTSMLFGRDFGNVSKTIINYGLEEVNKEYLEDLRTGEYDPYKDALQYSVIPPEKKGVQTGAFDLLKNMTGSFGPAIKTTDLVLKKAFEPEKKEADAIERREKEISRRIPLEVLGNLGLVPLYKEIRKSMMKDVYQKTLEEQLLGSYESKEQMKKTNPKLYERNFGEGTMYERIKEREKKANAKIKERKKRDDKD